MKRRKRGRECQPGGKKEQRKIVNTVKGAHLGGASYPNGPRMLGSGSNKRNWGKGIISRELGPRKGSQKKKRRLAGSRREHWGGEGITQATMRKQLPSYTSIVENLPNGGTTAKCSILFTSERRAMGGGPIYSLFGLLRAL